MKTSSESGVVFWDSNETPYEQVPDSEARVKYMEGNDRMTPFVLLATRPAGSRVKPHKHPYGRLEYIIEGEIEFFEGQDALDFWRGKPVKGERHGPGEASYVPGGTLYAYLILKETKLLHVHEANPGRARQIADTEDDEIDLPEEVNA